MRTATRAPGVVSLHVQVYTERVQRGPGVDILAGLARIVVLERGEVLCVEGAAPTHVALVPAGRLKATP